MGWEEGRDEEKETSRNRNKRREGGERGVRRERGGNMLLKERKAMVHGSK